MTRPMRVGSDGGHDHIRIEPPGRMSNAIFDFALSIARQRLQAGEAKYAWKGPTR